MGDTFSSVAAADMADTGQWRLEAAISRFGIHALLRAIRRPGVPVRPLLDASWSEESEGLLKRIENAVYDHPQVLDDYSARIIIDTPLTVWCPSAPGDTPEPDAGLFTSIYGGSPDDVMCDVSSPESPVCLYSLVAGLKAFLGRTFPGAIVKPFQSLLLDRAFRLFPDSEGILVVMRPKATDFVAVSKGTLSAIATRPALSPSDVAYHALNTLNTLRFSPESASVAVMTENYPPLSDLSGDSDDDDFGAAGCVAIIRQFCPAAYLLHDDMSLPPHTTNPRPQ
ncbi:MAG: DUF3822 family protein [Muribaculaceae bacterium]|nr:DUF3822 family protein [Muribaculaceae bacterium]